LGRGCLRREEVNTVIEHSSKFDNAPFIFPGEVKDGNGGLVGVVEVMLTRLVDGIVALHLLYILARP